MSDTVKDNEPVDFIRNIISEDVKNNKNDGKVITRFPPEPNGYLHIGHAKAFCLNFSVAKEFEGVCHLRFDDTNPVKEDDEYIHAIMRDIKWMGFDWKDHLHYASDYYEKLYSYAVELIKKGKAFVCELSVDEVREYRGTLTEPGKESPFRNRLIEDNLRLFEGMRKGDFAEGSMTLRAKIDMGSPNIHMRDPAIYRIKHVWHHRTGNEWCIYPMYDFAHCLSDSIEGITHSLCSLEFEIHRPLYDWILDELDVKCHPQQIEFNRLNLTYTVMSKRKLIQLVEEQKVTGWDDPRMPSLSGMRRRGYTSEAIKQFIDRAGLTKREQVIDVSLLEYCVREDLNKHSARVMGVLNPLKVVITNYPDEQVDELDAVNNPEDAGMGTRKVPFSKVFYIERDDFRINEINVFCKSDFKPIEPDFEYSKDIPNLEPEMVTLSINGGRKNKISAGDILGTLTSNGGIAGSDVGKINRMDYLTFVAIKRNSAKRAINILESRLIKGRKFLAMINE